MEVVLLEDIRKVGRKGDTVTLMDGYARNLISKKQAAELNAKTLNDIKLQKQHEEKVAEKKLQDAISLKDRLAGMTIRVSVKVGKDGKLFGSVSSKEIAEAFKNQLGIEIDKKKIVLAEPIKELGKKELPIKLHPEVSATLSVEVIGE
ncbi:MAG: 50S ribosomal protein L9 [Lachnospiraceae bacterium]|nr:50S ribosomal protein L9 [Lachnospiraceae bacterium]